MIREINKEEIFNKEIDEEKILEIILKKKKEVECEVLSYCIMDNHVHLLVKADIEIIKSIMRRINGSYAMYYNKKYERVGHVFQDRYKASLKSVC